MKKKQSCALKHQKPKLKKSVVHIRKTIERQSWSKQNTITNLLINKVDHCCLLPLIELVVSSLIVPFSFYLCPDILVHLQLSFSFWSLSAFHSILRIEPVSYTHLDVYKRQVHGCTGCKFLIRWYPHLHVAVCTMSPYRCMLQHHTVNQYIRY